jgi:putative phage-type endonuclease
MNIISGSQQSAEWLDARRGMITASRIKDVMNILKNGSEGAGRKRYKRELAMERLTGLTASHYVTPAMEHGIAYEPIVRSAYELEKDVIVETVGFVRHPTLPFTGASPDGLIGLKGALEIKSPQEDTMVEWIRAGVVPDDHEDQCDWVMECCEREWIDFAAGHPRFKTLIIPRERNEKRLEEIRAGVIQFNDEVNALVDELRPWVIQMPELAALDDMPAPPIEQWPAEFDKMFSGDITQ